MIYIESLEDLAHDLRAAIEIRKKSRRRIFKFLRTKMDFLKDCNPWAYGKMNRGYSNEIKDDQLVSICEHFIERSSRRR